VLGTGGVAAGPVLGAGRYRERSRSASGEGRRPRERQAVRADIARAIGAAEKAWQGCLEVVCEDARNLGGYAAGDVPTGGRATQLARPSALPEAGQWETRRWTRRQPLAGLAVFKLQWDALAVVDLVLTSGAGIRRPERRSSSRCFKNHPALRSGIPGPTSRPPGAS
jgi:hypothetical protein